MNRLQPNEQFRKDWIESTTHWRDKEKQGYWRLLNPGETVLNSDELYDTHYREWRPMAEYSSEFNLSFAVTKGRVRRWYGQ